MKRGREGEKERQIGGKRSVERRKGGREEFCEGLRSELVGERRRRKRRGMVERVEWIRMSHSMKTTQSDVAKWRRSEIE